MAGVEACAARTKVHGVPGPRFPLDAASSVCTIGYHDHRMTTSALGGVRRKMGGWLWPTSAAGSVVYSEDSFLEDIYGSFYLRFFGYKGF